MMIDTAGIDDEGELGQQRVGKSISVLNKTDIAVLVADGCEGLQEEDLRLLERFEERGIPYLVVLNKADLWGGTDLLEKGGFGLSDEQFQKLRSEDRILSVSAMDRSGIEALKERMAGIYRTEDRQRQLVGDLIAPLDLVVLVIPIDKAAPKGRLILPQQQTIRDLLDGDCQALVVKENGLKDVFESIGKKPKLVITDSQVFGRVSKDTPKDILLTSFSILFARYKGNLESVVRGVTALDRLKDGDQVLISEGCSHHRQCGDIGTVKLPAWIREYTKKELQFEFTSGTEFPDDLTPYQLIVHCGGCMLNER